MKVQNINNGWKFFKDCKSLEETKTMAATGVNLPHTWNKLDGQDGGADYFRGECFYEKIIDLSKKVNKDYYLEFRGVNAVCEVYINDKIALTHKGGFSTFRLKLTDLVNDGINKISVSVDNTDFDDVYPETADFTFFGGIYRDVNLIEVNESRFDLDYFGSEGVMITPTVNKNKSSVVKVDSFLTNVKETQDLIVTVSYQGEVIDTKTIKASERVCELKVKEPHLWDGVKSPNLYEANVKLVEGEEVLDERNIRFGFRTFSVDKDGFVLNGNRYPLHGVSRHQDRLDKGWAIGVKEHDEDMALIKEVGANTIRLAHYQHDQHFYDLCDENGMVVWAEIPYISVHLPKGDQNAMSQMRELVIQNYNHASILFWGLSNEITIGGESPEQLELHKNLEKLVKSLDKTRLTTMACVTMCDTHSELLNIPDIFSYNHYFGWYMGEVKDNASWLDNFRKEFPDRPLGLSEYGCEAILSLHSEEPKCGDYSEEYQAYYHEEMLKIFKDRPWLWSTHVWNMFDFAVDSRDEGGVKGRNNKGLVTYDRKTKKDSFFIYKAYWSDEPFVHICSKRFVKRHKNEIEVKIYSNLEEVSLYVNNRLIETKKGDKVFTFSVPLKLGKNHIVAEANEVRDEAVFKRVLRECKSYKLKKSNKEVENWFMKDGVKYEFLFPEGKFSIKDKFSAIYKTPEGERVLNNLVAEALKSMDPNADPVKFLKGMRPLIGGMTIERIAALAGNKLPKEMLFHVNEELNKIDKPVK